MADDKKPKIDLKSRLQRMGGPGGAPAPVPVPTPAPPASRPPGAPPMAPPSVPPPSGIPKPMPAMASPGGVPLDASNPLAAVAAPFKPAPSRPAPAIAQPQRIEVDEGAVQQARSGARKQGLVAGLVVAVVLGAIGWVGGGASQQKADHEKSVKDAHDLAADLLKAKTTVDQMKDKVTAGGKSILGDRKFPGDLARDLAGMHVDFSGDKLFGRRFAGVPADTTTGLFEFINRVQALNDKKDLIVALLNKLQKPIESELARPANAGLPISLVVVVDKNTSEVGTSLFPLVTPIAPDDKAGVPDKLTFSKGGSNVQLPRLTGEKIPATGAAITVAPNSFDRACPSPVKGQMAQMMTSMNSLIDDIQGQKGDESVGLDAKPGISELANKLADALNKVN